MSNVTQQEIYKSRFINAVDSMLIHPSEIDNHADTHCFGDNFIVREWTGFECDVSPFLDEYNAVEKVPIVSAITAVTLQTGQVILLLFGQGLWFGSRMNKSLINPNQCRAFGIPTCDDPTDPYRKLGFEVERHRIPFDMRGTTACFDSRRPTPEELDTCPMFTMSDPDYWDPHNIQFNIADVSVNDREADCRIGEYELCLSECSTSYVPQLLSSSLIAAVQVSSAHVDQNKKTKKRKFIEEENVYNHDDATFHGDSQDRKYSTFTSDRHHAVTPELLARKWGIGLKTAKDTLANTTQLAIRSAIGPLTRRYRTDLLQQSHKRLKATFYTDTLFAKAKSVKQNKCAQIYTDGKGYVDARPVRNNKSDTLKDTLADIASDVGIPNVLVADGASEIFGPKTSFQALVRYLRITMRASEPDTQKQNRAEDAVRELKRRWRRRSMRRRIPKAFWDFTLVYEGEILSRCCRNGNDFSGLERITGDTQDISEWLEFEMYDLVWYWDNQSDFDNPKLGRWLGISHRVGAALCYHVVGASGIPISRTTVQHLTRDEADNPEIQEMIREFQRGLESNLNPDQYMFDENEYFTFLNDDIPGIDERYPEDFEEDSARPYYGGDVLPDIDDFIGAEDDEKAQADSFDAYLGAEVLIPVNGEKVMAKVLKRTRFDIGRNENEPYNPLLDRSRYEVKYPDGSTEEVPVNLIVENMFSGVDSEGHHYQLLSEITDHRTNVTAIHKNNGFIKSRNGTMVPKKTTRGWELLVEWKDGSSEWLPLKDLKVAFPVELAEYAVANQIEDEPAFKWWVPHTLKKRNSIIAKVKSKYWRTTHKFGIKVPKDYNEAVKFDLENGNRHWQDATAKEMGNVRVAFKKREDLTAETAKKVLVGYQRIRCHLIFDIKMDGKFTRKARFVAGGHTTSPPSSVTYSSVVSRDSVRICFVIATLNGLDVMACDVGNAYLNAPCAEKIYTIAGPEFGSDNGAVMEVVRALYGLKSSGASWRRTFAQNLLDLGFKPSRADPDVWLKAKTKQNGDQYYSYILVYVDDVLHFDEKPQDLMDKINDIYRFKEPASIPSRYLGANIEKVALDDNTGHVWSMHSKDYVTHTIAIVEGLIKGDLKASEKEINDGSPLKKYGKKAGERPFPEKYRPEVDTSPELNEDLASRYLQLIGMLRWCIELGRVDIHTQVSVLSQYQCSPRQGHLDALYRIFWFLKNQLKDNKIGRITFDPSYPDIDERLFSGIDKKQWEDFYPDAREDLPLDAPPPRGKHVIIQCWVDADHAGNLMTRRSHTGILIYVNNTPIIWYSKRQNTVESASFGSEFIALRIATEQIKAIRYKLRHFGVEIRGPAYVYCDNRSVVTNASIPTSILNKKHNAICYHLVREAQAADIIKVGWIDGEYNKADLLTKTTLSTSRGYALSNSVFESKCTPLKED